MRVCEGKVAIGPQGMPSVFRALSTASGVLKTRFSGRTAVTEFASIGDDIPNAMCRNRIRSCCGVRLLNENRVRTRITLIAVGRWRESHRGELKDENLMFRKRLSSKQYLIFLKH